MNALSDFSFRFRDNGDKRVRKRIWRNLKAGPLGLSRFQISHPPLAEREGTSSDFLRKELALIGEAVRRLGL